MALVSIESPHLVHAFRHTKDGPLASPERKREKGSIYNPLLSDRSDSGAAFLTYVTSKEILNRGD